jgi:PmbA protein
MKVLFLPEAMYALVWRLTEATSGRNFYEKTSPIRDKVGQPVLHEKLTIVDRALDDTVPGARAFDDEGTPCRNLPIFEQGVLRNFYCDLYYAAKLNAQPTGNGYRGDAQYKPHPELGHLTIQPGDKSFAELVKLIDHGIVVGGAMGAHSGNILNGDYSIGLSPGILVEGGEVKGQVKDAMVAGNVYETMKNVIAVENAVYPAAMGRFPAVLFDGVSVATRG